MVVDTTAVATYRPTGAGNQAGTVADIITSVADTQGVDPTAAQADAWHESGMRPTAVGDGGTSFGLYQLHEGGELDDLPGPTLADRIAQADDPATNATQALSVVAGVRATEPTASWGQVFADAERPANKAAYATAINQLIAQARAGKAPWAGAGSDESADNPTSSSSGVSAQDVEAVTQATAAAHTAGFDLGINGPTFDGWGLNPFADADKAAGAVFSKSTSDIVKAFGPILQPISDTFQLISKAFTALEWIIVPTNFLRVIIFLAGSFLLAYGTIRVIKA
jgi:hypothetical protein